MKEHQTNQNNSREIILSNLRKAGKRAWEDRWSETVPEGNVFDTISDPPAYFKQELESLGGQVFIENNEVAAWTRLGKLKQERGWKQFWVADEELKKKCLELDLPVSECVPGEEDEDISVGLTSCEALIALTGSILVSSAASGRKINIFPPIHVVIAGKDLLVDSIKDGLEKIENKYGGRPSQISLISGPSRTADIEKTLVMGAHGPRELITIIY
ncbi:LutC/YkgG family protein [Thermophagus xiamenensis]|uniref:L-lactate dehydrogenase complex protein LldG n=1 Tax=Thermophagus xiamenensis TaxID=385682 RepID=A0A1I1ULH3_9BACT|nr:lactate utilization protein [Thermophagus xiamenensis]SFD71425.1 L-lactate dehydrogenase complex protein LldG [Thermophagus xiamenensis]